ncbi:MAG: hypothetical protein HC856_04960 [Pseudanabaena sp. RU_4_16]|nr:hypothetical protein [Pseudanabaena sp. RU_4_16]
MGCSAPSACSRICTARTYRGSASLYFPCAWQSFARLLRLWATSGWSAPSCHELRINDEDKTWRIIYRIDEDRIVIVDVFAKTTNKTPKSVIDVCKQRLKRYDEV